MKFNSLSVFLSLLIITVLPFTAYAELTTDESDNPAVSDYDPPYALAEPTQADQGHIATTAYVKGAYNDTIAAINNVNDYVAVIEREVFGEDGLSNTISSVQSDVSDLSTTVDNKRVQIYTTWGGNGTAEVAFINATPQQQGGGGKQP